MGDDTGTCPAVGVHHAGFDRWWDAQGRVVAAEGGLEPSEARVLGWFAWRAGREQLNEATAHQRLQPVRG